MRIKVDGFYRMVSFFPEGTILYFNDKKQLHRLDGPAVKMPDGEEQWFKDGKLHRIDGPAQTLSTGREIWYKNGKLHRLDGPAVESISIDRESSDWYKNGKLHRIGGPATRDHVSMEHFSGRFPLSTGLADCWYKNGKLHREDGPAVIFLSDTIGGDTNGRLCDWYLHGKRLDDPKRYFTEEDIWLLLRGSIENNLPILNKLHMNMEMQDYIIQNRPDLINKIGKLHKKIKERYCHELSLSGVDI